jgi:hypothetical protein
MFVHKIVKLYRITMYDTDNIFFLMDTHLKTPWIALLCMFLETLVLA